MAYPLGVVYAVSAGGCGVGTVGWSVGTGDGLIKSSATLGCSVAPPAGCLVGSGSAAGGSAGGLRRGVNMAS